MTDVNALGQPIGTALSSWTRCAVPAAAALHGQRCRLEPLDRTEHGADLYRALHQDQTGQQWTYMAFGPFDTQNSFDAFLDAATAEETLIGFAIVDPSTGRAEGMASYSRIDPTIGSIEVGAVMYGPKLRRSAAATEAMYLMAAYIFDELGYRRYEWKCDALNVASILAAQRLGFTWEGTWRNATIYKGRNRDTAWFSLTDTDWPTAAATIRTWLDPDNFVDGDQQSSLSQQMARRINQAPFRFVEP